VTKPKLTPLISKPALAFLLFLLAILGCRSTNQSKAPSWAKATVLSDHEDHPSKVISDGEFVFFITGGTIASRQEGTNNIKRVSLADGSVTVLVKGGDQIPESSLAVDDKFLYWSDGGNIFRVLKQGGTSEKILPNTPQPDEMIMDSENIYWLIWAGEGSPPQPIMFSPKSGGQTKQLTPPQPPTSGLAIDKDFVYWMTGSGIRKISKTGGEITDVYRNPSKQPSLGLAQDTNNFYFCQMNEKGHSALMKLSKQTGQVSQLAPSINHTMDFVLGEANIYYFDEVPGTGSFGPVALKKVSKNGGDPITLDQGEAGWIRHLAIDSKQIYFTDISKVYALPK
jgi:sugar lactone lactonase YvrE